MSTRGANRRKHGGTAVKIVVTGPFSAGGFVLPGFGRSWGA